MTKEYVESQEGSYYVTGTRASLDSIVCSFRRGDSPETICQNFEVLCLEEVYGAIAYYLANQIAVDHYLNRKDEKWANAKAGSDPRPNSLRKRILRAREALHAIHSK
jgi:uncharacterized protein (DUF433 family)